MGSLKVHVLKVSLQHSHLTWCSRREFIWGCRNFLSTNLNKKIGEGDRDREKKGGRERGGRGEGRGGNPELVFESAGLQVWEWEEFSFCLGT